MTDLTKDAADAGWFSLQFGIQLVSVQSVIVIPASTDGATSSADVQAASPQIGTDGKSVSVWLSGGLPGEVYLVRASVTASDTSNWVGETKLIVNGPTTALSDFYVVTLPIQPGASWDDLAWPGKRSFDSLDFAVDCAAWLDHTGYQLVSATVGTSTDPLLVVGTPRYGLTGGQRTRVIVQISGGTVGVTGTVPITLNLSNSRAKTVNVLLEVT